ncbi:MAG: bifunctional demethylmenaquinone methyltransferase/2-methoxy-6-polyprenyl-1,4-benzoquinol methylase UbiE [Planctomycetes bacterium]|nr:bifunctional demethylmenaquinone methyltransferase/2-methoxy-6-polyprenyl-1,4-benzoquinol methylase UbiE [Planctomycetota bacterium]
MPKLLNESSVDYQDPEKGRAVQGMFAGIAKRYDLLNHLLSFNQDKRWRKLAVKMAGVSRESRVLDVCCGTGDLALEFAKVVNEGNVTASDFTPQMVEIASKKSAKAGKQIPWLVADTMALPFADARFDVCSVAFGIRNVQDIRAGLREMARVVKAGGRVVVLEFTQPKSKFFQRLYRFYMTRVLPKIGQIISGSRDKAYSYLPDSVAQFPGAEEFAKIMGEVGLEDVHYRLKTFGVVSIHVGSVRK